jgi:hypothetical protein
MRTQDTWLWHSFFGTITDVNVKGTMAELLGENSRMSPLPWDRQGFLHRAQRNLLGLDMHCLSMWAVFTYEQTQ